jgi:hypothetical protein
MSEQPKHSPAPWFWDDKDAMPWTDYDAAESAPFLMNANGCPIMTGSDIRIAYEADGRLIAAAPDLLEALKGVITDKAPSYHDCTDNGEAECSWCIARAAIAKAEGRGE